MTGNFAIACRNVRRGGTRSLVALALVTLTVVALTLSAGFIDWLLWAMRESTIRAHLGHLQIVREGYFRKGESDPFAHLIPPRIWEPMLHRLAEDPDVVEVAPRLRFGGLLSTGDFTLSFLGEAVDPAREGRLSEFLKVASGAPLADGPGIVLGQGLARNLRAEEGQELVLLANTATGGRSAVELPLLGTFFTNSKAFDDVFLRLALSDAQRLLGTEGVHSVIVLLRETEQTAEAARRISGSLSGAEPGLEVVPWFERAELYLRTERLLSRQIGFVHLVTGIVVILGMSTTLTMGILGRSCEIATLGALGFRRRRILALFFLEGMVLGLAGCALGAILGPLLAWIISWIGIPMPPPPGVEVEFLAGIRAGPGVVGPALVTAIASALVASVFPAWRAARMPLLEGLRGA